MPKIWKETIEAHRHDVRLAIIDATAELVEKDGLISVTMSRIAETAGIGRATLYKYFPDIESILMAWHRQQIDAHLTQLREVQDRGDDARERLEAVMQAYAQIQYGSRGHDDTELAAFLHRDHQVSHAESQVFKMVRQLLADAADDGSIRTDVGADELATYCLHALNGARGLRSKAAVRRLVSVTTAGLAPE